MEHGAWSMEPLYSRPVSSYERLFASSSLGTICQWARFCRNGKPCTQNELTKALRAVHPQIAALQCIMHKEEGSDDTTLSFIPDLEPVLENRKLPEEYNQGQDSPRFLEQVVAEEVIKGMGATPDDAYDKALWRGIVFDDGWIILIFHHVICDGYSRKLFIKHLMEALSNPTNALNDGSKIEMQPDAYGLLQGLVKKDENKEKDDHQEEQSQLAQTKASWPAPDVAAPVEERYNQVPSAIISNVSALRKKCKSQGVTVTSMLMAALALSVRRQMNIPTSEKVDMRKMSWGVDIRRHLSNSNIFGCYVFFNNADSECILIQADDSVWSIAVTIHKAMAKSSSLDLAFKKVRDTKCQMEEPMTPEKLMPLLSLISGPDQGRNGAIYLSNIGVVEAQSSCGTVQVDKLFSIASQAVIGTYAFMNTATINDSLFVTLGSVWPTVSKERGKAMLDEFVNVLQVTSG